MDNRVSSRAFHGEFTSADAQALSEENARLVLYRRGSSDALTVGSADYVVITDIVISTLTAMTVDIFDGANNTVAASEKIAHVLLAANSAPVVIQLKTPFVCLVGKTPKVKTSAAGQIDVNICGWIEKE